MDWWLLTFFLGAILSLFLPIVPVLFQLFLLLLAAMLFFSYKRLRTSSGLLFGMLWVLVNAFSYQQQVSHELKSAMHNKQTILVTGEVLTLINLAAQKVNQEQRYKFNFKVLKINQQHLSTPIIVRLNWDKSPVEVVQGQLLVLAVKLKPAHGLANIGGFNYQAWLKSKNIVATGYVLKDKKRTGKLQISNQIIADSLSIRQSLFNQYQAILTKHNLSENTLSPLMLALTFGERSQLSKAHWQVLQATGTGHLIAISGLHIGLLASASFIGIMLLFRLLPLQAFPKLSSTLQKENHRYLAIFISIFMAIFYSFLAGFSLPTQRALVMLLLYWFTRLFAVKLSIKRWLLITLFILILVSPFSLFTASFWLSVYAVTIIFMTLWRFHYFLKRGNAFVRFIKGLIIIQLSLTLMLLPISAFFFQKLSIVALFANLLAVPWMSFISIPCALISVVVMPLNEFLAKFFLQLSLESITVLWRYLVFLAELPFAQQPISQWQLLILTAVTGMLFFKLFTSSVLTINKGSFIAMAASFFLIVLSVNRLAASQSDNQGKLFAEQVSQYQANPEQSTLSKESIWQLQLFDVGQGLSVLISRDGHALLYDTGAAYPSGFNMVDAVILPYLQYSGIKQLDKVFLSHSDNDHAGGLQPLLAGVKIKQLITNDDRLAKSHHKSLPCQQDMVFNWQGLRLDVLWPIVAANKTQHITNKGGYRQKNDDSCVLLISDGKHKILLTGDISKKVEQELMLLYPELTADVLLVPHHGSKTSSSAAFLKQVAPKVALVSAGFINRWRMPVSLVVSRYEQHGIQLLKSSDKGQLSLTFSEDINIESYHDDLRPFWFSH